MLYLKTIFTYYVFRFTSFVHKYLGDDWVVATDEKGNGEILIDYDDTANSVTDSRSIVIFYNKTFPLAPLPVNLDLEKSRKGYTFIEKSTLLTLNHGNNFC